MTGTSWYWGPVGAVAALTVLTGVGFLVWSRREKESR